MLRIVTTAGVGIAALTLVPTPASSNALPKGAAFAATVRNAHRATALRRQSHRPASVVTCTTSDSLSFVGIAGEKNVAGQRSAVAGGAFNEACSTDAAIGSGYLNTISAAGDGNDAGDSFIGGGSDNAIAGLSAFLGAGYANEVDGAAAFTGAGYYNLASGKGSVVGAGGAAYFAVQSSNPNPGNVAAGVDSFVGAGDLNQVSGQGSFIGAGGSTYAATGTAAASNTISGTDSFIGAGDQNNVTASWAFVGGGVGNAVNGSGSFVGAGGYLASASTGLPNYITGVDSFVGAGDFNSITTNDAFIGGGHGNAIRTTGVSAAIAGGDTNFVSSAYGAIAGGIGGKVAGTAAAIGGGEANLASGAVATIPGGYHNVASGTASFAAGYGAEALTSGAFVWADESSTARVKSTLNNQFVARASGGVYFYSNAASTVGVRLPAGGGAWSSLSDRNMKTDIAPLDDAAVLDKIAALPVSVWSYRSEPGVRHVGPMAQNFYAAFKVGEDDRHITSIDEDGVALAAIKALRDENVEMRRRLARDAVRFARDEAQRARDGARLLALERKMEMLVAR